MTEFLSQYGLFLAKTLTLVIAIIVTVSALVAIASRTRSEEGTLVVANVNEKMEDLRTSLQAETLPKKVMNCVQNE